MEGYRVVKMDSFSVSIITNVPGHTSWVGTEILKVEDEERRYESNDEVDMTGERKGSRNDYIRRESRKRDQKGRRIS